MQTQHSHNHCLKGAMLLALCGTFACSPGGDVDVNSDRFLIYDIKDNMGDYELTRVTIKTLNNVREADGDVVYLRGGGSLESPITDPQTREEWEQALVIEDHIAPQIEYTVDRDGTVIPWDFDSAMMLTVYHHFESARDYFDELELSQDVKSDLGAPVGELVGRLPCYYYPTLKILGVPLPLFTDNAAFAFTLNAFIVPPRKSLVDAVPIYANRGVITHEYSHAVFNRLVYNGVRVPDPTFLKWDSGTPQERIAYNELGGLDEGIADIFGALDTQDPDYIAASIDNDLLDRDLAVDRYYESCLHEAVETGTYPAASSCGGSDATETTTGKDSEGVRFDYQAGGAYDSHHLGAVAASIVWDLRELQGLDDRSIAEATIKALRKMQNPTAQWRISDFFNHLYDVLPSSAQSKACTLFKDRIIVLRDEIQCQP